MMAKSNVIPIYEHGQIHAKNHPAAVEALTQHFGDGRTKKVTYYSLGNNSICFNQFVGVLQVGSHTIEVLPKIDDVVDADQDSWSKVLIDMLRVVYGLEIKSSDFANLRHKRSTVLDVYMELFVKEVEYLVRQGLGKSYRQTEGNRAALKGKLIFGQQIRHNLVHAERFYVRHTTYDRENVLNRILYTALELLRGICQHPTLSGRVSRLLLDFPELQPVVASEALFDRLVWNRKTERYRKAINIAKMLLLNYYPDVVQGRKDVLALMFDMNKLWEKYVYAMLRRSALPGWKVSRSNQAFWKPLIGKGYKELKLDILLSHKDTGERIILDTKWKVPQPFWPSDQDLRQIFAYTKRWKAARGYLLYPGAKDTQLHGVYQDENPAGCGLLAFSILENGRVRKDLGGRIWEILIGDSG